MNVQLTITLNPKNPTFTTDMGRLLNALAEGGTTIASDLGLTENDDEATPAPATKKTRARKEPTPAVETKSDDDETEESDGFELGSNGEGEDDEEKLKEPVVTKSDMLRVLKAHPSKEKVTKLLQTRFKVKNINELKETQYAEVVAAVEKLK